MLSWPAEDHDIRGSVLVRRGHKDFILAANAEKFITFFHHEQPAATHFRRCMAFLTGRLWYRARTKGGWEAGKDRVRLKGRVLERIWFFSFQSPITADRSKFLVERSNFLVDDRAQFKALLTIDEP